MNWLNSKMSWLLFYITACLTMCFRFYDDPPGGDPPLTDPPLTDPPVADPNDLSMDQIKGIIQTAVKDANKEEIDNFKKEILDVNRKAIFPFQDGNFGTGEVSDITQKSVLDTSYFSKQYRTNIPNQNLKYASMHPAMPAGMLLGDELVNIGGPFKRLSPQMETFAKFIKMRGSMDNARSAGLDMKVHNDTVKDQMKQAGLNEGTLAQGGVFVPIEFYAGVIEFATQQSQIISKVWRLPMTSLTMRLPRLVQAAGSYFGGITFYTPDEGGEKQSTTPQFERLTLEARKLIAVLYITDELIADSLINIVNYVTGLFTRAFQYELERRIIAGLGTATSGPCLGIINDPAINLVPRRTAGTVGYFDIRNLDSALDENFTDLSWMIRKATQNTVSTLRDTNNHPIFFNGWEAFRGGGTIHPPVMYGYPVYMTRNVPVMGVQGDIILGDLSWYLLGMRQDLTIDQSEHVRFLFDEQTLRFVMRFDGMPAISIAFAILGDVES